MEIVAFAFFLSFTAGAYCILHCGIFVPAASGAAGESRKKGIYTILNIFAGRFAGYAAAGIIAGTAGMHISDRFIRSLDPYVYIVMGLLFLLYGTEKVPACLRLCTEKMHAGPFLLGFAAGIHPCPAFIMLVYETMKYTGFFTALGVFMIFFAVTSAIILPVLVLPVLMRETYRNYMRRTGLTAAVLLGFFFLSSGVSMLFQGTETEPVPQAAAMLPQTDTGDTVLSGVQGDALRNGLVVIGFMCAAALGYGLRLPYARYGIGAASIAVTGVWLKTVPGSAAFADMWTRGLSRGLVFIIIPLAVILSAAAAGRLYCGYVCPAGILAELLGKAGPRLRVSRPVHGVLVKFKYVLLAAAVILIPAGFRQAGQFEPFGLFASLFTMNAGAWIYAAVFLAGSFAAGRIWCMYLCPVGALLALVSRNCLFPKHNICKGCRILRSTKGMEGECMRCLQK